MCPSVDKVIRSLTICVCRVFYIWPMHTPRIVQRSIHWYERLIRGIVYGDSWNRVCSAEITEEHNRLGVEFYFSFPCIRNYLYSSSSTPLPLISFRLLLCCYSLSICGQYIHTLHTSRMHSLSHHFECCSIANKILHSVVVQQLNESHTSSRRSHRTGCTVTHGWSDGRFVANEIR